MLLFLFWLGLALGLYVIVGLQLFFQIFNLNYSQLFSKASNCCEFPKIDLTGAIHHSSEKNYNKNSPYFQGLIFKIESYNIQYNHGITMISLLLGLLSIRLKPSHAVTVDTEVLTVVPGRPYL